LWRAEWVAAEQSLKLYGAWMKHIDQIGTGQTYTGWAQYRVCPLQEQDFSLFEMFGSELIWESKDVIWTLNTCIRTSELKKIFLPSLKVSDK
jgi:hypothetical protein